MAIIRQYTHPKIEFIWYKNFKVYHTFSDSRDTNLQSYNYTRAVNNIDGSFSISIKATSVNSNDFTFANKVDPLDIVKIYDDADGDVDFIGIVSDIGYASTATQGGGIIQISGKSIDSLFNRYKISVDKTAMAVFNSTASNIENNSELMKKDPKTNKWLPLELNDIIKTSWDKFNQGVNNNKEISNFRIGEIITKYYGETFWNEESGKIEFQYPIANHLFKDGESKFIDYLKELLPEKVYECFGTIKDNKPILQIRQVPFTSDRWNSLGKAIDVPMSVMTDYYLRRSDNEVYTTFFSYVQGSTESPDFYRAITATEKGLQSYRTSDLNKEKAELYGYEPLFLSFTGYPSGFNDDATKNNTNNSVIEKFIKLNNEAQEMYSRLDEMYSGNFSIVKTKGFSSPKTGEKVKITDMEFYINDEKHVWQYGKPVTISYNVSRGGFYHDGQFSKGNINSILKSSIKN